MIYNNILELIGNTPLLKIADDNVEIYAKCEFKNPGGSVKDRIALAMIKEAISSGKITANTPIIEPTSGNTGVGLAMVCAALGFQITLTMPESMSLERRALLKAYGAKLVLTPKELGMKGAHDKAVELAAQCGGFIPSQFDNPANPKIHEETTAKEILAELGSFDALVAGFGTGGSISGIAKVAKAANANLKAIAVEPAASPLLSRGVAGPHAIQGIGANFIPANLNKELIDEFFLVSNEDAKESAKNLAKQGILVGISSGANIFAAKQIAKRPEFQGKKIVTILCDTGERYLSTGVFEG